MIQMKLLISLILVLFYSEIKAQNYPPVDSSRINIPGQYKIAGKNRPPVLTKDTMQSGNNAEDAFFEQVGKLPEFIKERKRVMALREKNINLRLHVDYLDAPFPDDSAIVHLSQMIVFEKPAVGTMKKLMTITFDKEKCLIISIEHHARSAENALKIDWQKAWLQYNSGKSLLDPVSLSTNQ